MKNIYSASDWLRYGLVVLSVAFIAGSLWFTRRLARDMAREEQQRVEIWAEATRQFIMADEDTDIDFVTSIIEQNTTIPVYMVDTAGGLIASRNVREPRKDVDAFYERKIKSLRASREPIVVPMGDGSVQLIYYDESRTLRWLRYFTAGQALIVVLFFVLVLLAFSAVKRAEQNNVWIGLSKETAHQLGTPISSLMSWSELLRERYPDDTDLAEIEKDADRLQSIANRFSQIGSAPTLESTDLNEVLTRATDYMKSRTSSRITYSMHIAPDVPATVRLNPTLFGWAIENLCKNAVDAIGNAPTGRISIDVSQSGRKTHIDISDTGHGIERRNLRRIFKPGFTTKQRGWGLGLSLTKRIVEEYHRGRISVKRSAPGQGTTFRITLKP